MDNLDDWIHQNGYETRERLSANADHFTEADRLECMLKRDFPDVMDFEGLDRQTFARMLVSDFAKELANELSKPTSKLADRFRDLAAKPTTVNHFNVTNSTISAPLQVVNRAAPVKWKATQRQNLNYCFIQDDALTIKDRVLFSYLCKLDRIEADGNKVKRTTKRLMRFSGYHRHTVKASVAKLIERGYVNDKLRALKSFKMTLLARDGEDATLVRSLMERNRKRGRDVGASWASKACGISRATFYRWVQHETGKGAE